MSKRKAKAMKPLHLSTATIPVAPWQSREDALAYLRGEYIGWHHALTQLVDAGVFVDPMMTEDLGSIARALADYLDEPRPMEVDSWESSEHVAELHRSLTEYRAFQNGGEGSEERAVCEMLESALAAAIEAHRQERDFDHAIAAAADLDAKARPGAGEAGA